MTDARIRQLLHALDPSPHARGWHGGPTLMGALSRVSVDQALWKPVPEQHCIWELTLHAAYWKYAVRRWLTGQPAGSFARSPANWPALPEPADDKAWKADRRLLKDEHRQLLEAVAAFPPSRLDEVPSAGKQWSYAELIFGAAAHDIWHTGQIQLLKRCRK